MRNIFIDLGGNNGCSVIKFRKLYDNQSIYKIYSFEPNPMLHSCYKNFKNHQLIRKAAWIYDGYIDFYLSKTKNSVGSSIYRDKIDPISKKNIIKDNHTKVECIDISKWIINNFKINDNIILKLDIEGAEYDILNKMIDDKSIDFINQIYIEWHYKKIPSISKNKHDYIYNNISHIKISSWDALNEN